LCRRRSSRRSGRIQIFGEARPSEVGFVVFKKTKICDYFRKLAHEVSFTDLEFLKDEMSHKFIDQGWNHDLGPAEWKPNPEAALDRKEFWETFRSCLDKLPERVADVFMLREMEEIGHWADLRGAPDLAEQPWVMPTGRAWLSASVWS